MILLLFNDPDPPILSEFRLRIGSLHIAQGHETAGPPACGDLPLPHQMNSQWCVKRLLCPGDDTGGDPQFIGGKGHIFRAAERIGNSVQEVIRRKDGADGGRTVKAVSDGIHILHFADMGDIRPIYFDKTYHIIPEAGGDKAYELLRRCMLEEQTVAIAKGVIGQSEHLMALIPTQTGILAEALFFHDEVKAMPKEPVRPELSEQELTMGRTIVGGMKETFAPEKYHDEYRERLWEIIKAKANNQEITQAPEEHQVSVINMMDALQKMLEQTKGNEPKKPRSRSKRVTA